MIDYAVLLDRLPAIIEATGFKPFDEDLDRVKGLAKVNADGPVFPLDPMFSRSLPSSRVCVEPTSGPQDLGEHPGRDLWARWAIFVTVTLTKKGASISISRAEGSTAQIKDQVAALAEAVAFAEALDELV